MTQDPLNGDLGVLPIKLEQVKGDKDSHTVI